MNTLFVLNLFGEQEKTEPRSFFFLLKEEAGGLNLSGGGKYLRQKTSFPERRGKNF
jgi:hypothetical protein